jgi:hypothetical protein
VLLLKLKLSVALPTVTVALYGTATLLPQPVLQPSLFVAQLSTPKSASFPAVVVC